MIDFQNLDLHQKYFEFNGKNYKLKLDNTYLPFILTSKFLKIWWTVGLIQLKTFI